MMRLDPPPAWLSLDWVRQIWGALGVGRFVGGAVRDTLLGRPIGDLDLAVPIPPPQVIERLLKAGLRALPTGFDHGTVTALADGHSIEITSLRRDIETDGRHAVVAFTDNWTEDAARRDLTMNALYLDENAVIWDPLGTGIEDCLAGRIRFVGDPKRRIGEDVLRLLRFYRFQATHGRMAADQAARAACRALSAGLARLPGERVRPELFKLLAAPDPVPTLRVMEEDSVLGLILPEPARLDDLARLVAQRDEPRDPVLRLACAIPGPEAMRDSRLQALRLSNKELARLDALFAADPEPDLLAPRAVQRRQIAHLGFELWADRLRLAAARSLGAGDPADLVAKGKDWTPPAFPLTGSDALSVGYLPGPDVGQALAEVRHWWEMSDFEPDRRACLVALRRLRDGTDPDDSDDDS